LSNSRYRYLCLVLWSAVAGCRPVDRSLVVVPAASDPEGYLIDKDSRAHHFGAVVSRPGRKLSHGYRLVNTTKHDIKIVGLVNRRPCCGEGRVGGSILHAGDETEVEVTLSVRQEFGDIVHETVVLTEPPQPGELVLRTTAKAYPPIRLEEERPESAAVKLTSAQPKRIDLNAFAYGSSNEPPYDLASMELCAIIKVGWAGPKDESPSDNGLTVASRRLAAWLDSGGPPGERKAEIVLCHRGQVVYRHALSWETVPAIAASPKTVVFQSEKRDYRVIVRASDQRPFRITRIECDVPGVRCRTAGSARSIEQVVEVSDSATTRSDSKRGTISVFTDHPAQEKTTLPILVLE
jgi:hypothetical protein